MTCCSFSVGVRLIDNSLVAAWMQDGKTEGQTVAYIGLCNRGNGGVKTLPPLLDAGKSLPQTHFGAF